VSSRKKEVSLETCALDYFLFCRSRIRAALASDNFGSSAYSASVSDAFVAPTSRDAVLDSIITVLHGSASACRAPTT
jgi:hypothetical protein